MTIKELPKIGLGTWKLKPKQATFSVIEAIKIGYRFIDTAQAYGNEAGVGGGLSEVLNSGIVKRDEIFVATKVHPTKVKPKSAYNSTLESLKKLQLDFLDLIYVHYPAFAFGYDQNKTLTSLSKLVDEGKVHHIGISNFTVNMIEEAIKACNKPIFACQLELHPYLHQNELLEYLKKKNIHFISYSPLGRGNVLHDPIIIEIAKKNKISTAQVSLAWIMSKGTIPIPKATTIEHLKDNYATKDIILPKEDLDQIDGIKTTKRFVHPPFVSPKEWKRK